MDVELVVKMVPSWVAKSVYWKASKMVETTVALMVGSAVVWWADEMVERMADIWVAVLVLRLVACWVA